MMRWLISQVCRLQRTNTEINVHLFDIANDNRDKELVFRFKV